MESLLISIIVPIVIPIVFGLLFRGKEKEERKLNINGTYKVYVSSSIRHFFMGWMLFCLIISIIIPILCITDKENTSLYMVLVASGIILLFFMLGFLGYAIAKWNYLIVNKNIITIVKGFKKENILIESIKYISTNDLFHGSLIAYNENYVPLFSVDGTYVGFDRLMGQLQGLDITKISKITKEDISSNNVEYKKYLKKSKVKVLKYTMLGFGILILGLYGIIKPQIIQYDFEDTILSGTIQSFEKNDDLLSLSFVDDGQKYIVNNIVYKALDKNIYNVINEGTSIIVVLYNNDSKYISQLEVDGRIYLHKEITKELENSNTRTGQISANVFLVISISMLILGVSLCIYQTINDKIEKKNKGIN